MKPSSQEAEIFFANGLRRGIIKIFTDTDNEKHTNIYHIAGTKDIPDHLSQFQFLWILFEILTRLSTSYSDKPILNFCDTNSS